LKSGFPPPLYNYIIDTHHTPHYAAGYLFKEINPRIGMVTHLEYEPSLDSEVLAGIRQHWDGLFVFGAPDVQVVNVTKDAIWAREAILPELGNASRLTLETMLKASELDEIPDVFEFPAINFPREEQQIEYLRQIEIDPSKYTPEDVARDLVLEMPPVRFNIKQMMAAQQQQKKEG